MRLGAGLILLVVVACGTTAEDVGTPLPSLPTLPVFEDEPTTPTAYEAPTDFPRPDPSEPFDTPTMDRMFPAGQARVVVWVEPPWSDAIGRIELRFEGPDGEQGDGRWDIPPPGDGFVHLSSIGLPANRYDLIMTVTGLSTDTSEADGVGEPLECRMTVDAVEGRTIGLVLLPGVGLLAEEPAEMCSRPAGAQWWDADGIPVSPDRLADQPGPAHCEWEGARFLFYGFTETLYVADPDGVVETDSFLSETGETLRGFEVLNALPADAEFTGFRSNGRELWISTSGSYAYLRTEDRVERWPRAELLCA